MRQIFSADCLISGSLSFLSLVFSALNLSTNEAVDLTTKLSVLFPETIRTPTHPVSMSTISHHNGLDMCLGTPNSNTRDELKVHCTHGISLSYLTRV